MLKNKKIIIGVTGSIAAYKVSSLIRLLIKEEAMVQVVMTPAAHDFVTPLTLATLSGQPVITDSFNPDDGEWNSHVELGLWADFMIVAPATANTLAKMAREKGYMAGSMMLSHIENFSTPWSTVSRIIDPDLVVRTTCGCNRK